MATPNLTRNGTARRGEPSSRADGAQEWPCAPEETVRPAHPAPNGPRRPYGPPAPPLDVASLIECVGVHIPAPFEPELLEWQYSYGQLRVLAHTCERCVRVAYEFGILGGYVIRRTDWTRVRLPVSHQTAPVHHALAWSWWQALLHGRAV